MKVFNIIKKHIVCYVKPLILYLKSGTERRRMRYARYYKNIKIDETTVLYESFFGRGMLDNPYAIFLYLIKCEESSITYSHIWVLDNKENHRDLIEEWSSHKNISFINRNSREYLKFLCKAKYLINNVTFPTYFTKKRGQIYVNTWHGIPIKTLGYDMPNGRTEVSNTIRNFLHTDYLVSTSPALTECYLYAHKLKNIYKGTIIEEGYPRLDLLKAYSRIQIIERLGKKGVLVDRNKKIILYAPTWRGKTYARAEVNISEYLDFKDQLEKGINISEYQVLIKVHPRVYELAKEQLSGSYFIPATLDSNEILSITDILISDYSSIYFDFLPTHRPILFYIHDLPKYKIDRGLYREPDQLPGPYSDSMDDIVTWINHIEDVQVQYRQKYLEELKYSGGYDIGKIASKVVDIVFYKRTSEYRLITASHQKKKIMFSRGRMIPNGITSSFLNLLDGIDYSEFDVSVMVTSGVDSMERQMIEKINPNVRVFYRNSTHNLTLTEKIKHEKNMKFGIKVAHHDMYLREWRRCYGEAEFDNVIDFEGFNLYFSLLSLQPVHTNHAIWLHNDMMEEYKGRFQFLMSIFWLYKYFDSVIACGYEVMEANRDKLVPNYINNDRLTYAGNMIGVERIKEGLNQKELCEYDGTTFIQTKNSRYVDKNKINTVQLIPFIPPVIDGMKTYRFVTIGRLSPEKNHQNLIAGFAGFQKDNPSSYLYILGQGPQKRNLEKQIQSFGLEHHVFLTGVIENPFAILKNCDCFILPSIYEGQPMVINEARVLHMPIIMSDFSTANGVKIENGQFMIGSTIEEIFRGLTAFKEGKVPSDYDFDVDEYNARTYKEFKKAIGLWNEEL